MIDWNLARQTGALLSNSGPAASGWEIDAIVAELRKGATDAESYVREFTGLTAASGDAPVLVVDRPGWVSANVESFSVVMEPLTAKVAQNLSPGASQVGSKVAGVELGTVLAFLGSKVLGQFDPFYSGPGDVKGRLLLVAPNIMAVERTLQVNPHDFRLWVCLHEETHRVQFSAVPWMRDFLLEKIGQLMDVGEMDTAELLERLVDSLPRVIDAVRGKNESSLAEIFQTKEQAEIVEELTGLMSLLEGHADVVMDGVGPTVISSVQEIRQKFNQRRKASTGVDKVLRRLLGLDKKMAQYSDGARFVRHVTDAVGNDGFNAVWAQPANLPSKLEIHDPQSWLKRVHG